MPHTRKPGPGSSKKFGRRTLLERSAAGGALLAANFFGLFGPAEAEAQGGAAPKPGAKMRRVVTAHNAEGKSYIASDELVDVAGLWTTKPDVVLGAAAEGERLQVAKATGETRFFVATIAPSKDPKPDLKNRIGFHRTPGIAYCYVLSGEVVFLVDVQEVRVKTGELVVERNTMHSWRNESSVPATLLITVVNATA
jgi:mannose-6-phosphate isomerase-like protein (cupin superfamily)